MIKSSKNRDSRIQETFPIQDTSPVIKKRTILKSIPLKPHSSKNSLDVIHPSFHVNSVLPGRHLKNAKVEDLKIFKTHDPRGLEHLNIYGMDYSFIQPSMDSVKHCVERGYYEYIGRQKTRVVIDVDLLKKFRQFEQKALKKTKKIPITLSITTKRTSINNQRKSF
jgi:hypothetical protein